LHTIISLEEALKLDNPIFIDMRSPVEFADGCIPGAINIPLFDDEERSRVGLVYRIEGPDEAKQLGLSLVSPRLPDIISQIRGHYQSGHTVIVYCWRGGMRSKAVVNILELVGIPARQLIGGYKNYRRYVLESLENFPSLPPIVVLCGSTGVGKTTLLDLMVRRGLPVIDLEKLANHRGSVFGQIGLGRPATAHTFDTALLYELKRLQNQPFIVVECESKRIGNVYLPPVLYQAMDRGRKILVRAAVETRVSRLIEEYLDIYHDNEEAIVASLKMLKKRLGTAKTQKLLDAFAADRVREVVRCLLVDYYDPLYGYENAVPGEFDYTVDAENLEQAASQIIDYLTK
jgi:tRNA 2-selenouridine synthase